MSERRPGLRPKATGLTLLEVLLASVVLGVALLGIAGAFPAAFRTVTTGGQITKATSLAHEMMEAIRSDRSDFIPRYTGQDGQGVSTDAPTNFPADWPRSCAFTWAEQFCGNTKLTRWAQDLTQDAGDGRTLARATGQVTVTDHESPVLGGGGSVSGTTSILRITVTVSWDDMTGRRQVTLTSTFPCTRPGCA